MTEERLAVQLMIAQSVLLTAEPMLIHHLGSRVSIWHFAAIRGLSGIILAILFARSLDVFRTQQLSVHVVRGIVGLLYSWVMVYSFSHLPFSDATAISYTQTIYIALFSLIILREKVDGRRWLAVAIGVLGALMISKPAFSDFNFPYLVALLGTSLNGLSFVLNRYANRSDKETTTMVYINLFILVGNLPPLFFTPLPSVDTAPWLVLFLFIGPLGMFAGIVALKYADASTLGPFTLLKLIMGIIGGFVVFREIPDDWAIVGIGFILASCAITTVKKKSVAQEPTPGIFPPAERKV
jgi:drug/metabolite transporter (DMT)-like permease